MLSLFVSISIYNIEQKINNHFITREEAKNELDIIKEFTRHYFSIQQQKDFSDYIEFLKIIIDNRTDIAKKRIYVPYIDRFNRTYYIEQLVW